MSKILIVDDSMLTRNRLMQYLSADDHEISFAENGKDGLENIRNQQFDVVLCDLLMPVMDGFQLLKELKNDNVNIPVIIVTADIQDTTRKKVLQLGASDVINKPPQPDELRKMIADVLEKGEK